MTPTDASAIRPFKNTVQQSVAEDIEFMRDEWSNRTTYGQLRVAPEDREDEEELPGPEWFQGGAEAFGTAVGPGFVAGVILTIILAAVFFF